MKFHSANSLHDFEFHDSEFSLLSSSDNCLSVTADYLNIHANACQNPFDTDMEIDKAHISFEGFKIVSYEIGRAWKVDENGNHYTDDRQIILYNDDAYRRFTNQLNDKITLFDFGIIKGNIYFIDAISEDPFFTVLFTFDNVTISWDNYKKESWYVEQNNK